MKKTIVTACLMSLALLAGQAFAANPDCEAKATEKKLAGAAKTSFMKKCEADSGASGAGASAVCEKSAADKKLAGAAKNSHIKKCMVDAEGKK